MYVSKGFTLVELSIVLVIIGLITGGVVGGRQMVHAAKVNKITQDLTNYRQAAITFIDIYDQWPGDFNAADQYWPDCAVGEKAWNHCSGNGDGEISGYEKFRMWEHLSLAELVSKKYDGSAGVINYGVSLPVSPIGKGGYLVKGFYYGKTGKHMSLASSRSGALQGKLLTTAEALKVDKKLDDGRPGLGALIIWQDNSDYGCTSGSGAAKTVNLSVTVPKCQLHWWLGNN